MGFVNSTISLCIICHDRPSELGRALASAHGFDEVLVLDMASDPPLLPIDGVRWMRSDENLGVTEGRNLLAAAASAGILVFLDDDASFASPDPSTAIRRGFARGDAPVALAFRVVRSTGVMVSSEYPFRGRPPLHDSARPCAYFLGGAVAIGRNAFLDAGGYDCRYRYSTEELDLAFSLQRDGSWIGYDPSIVVEHRPSTLGRGLNPEVPALRLRNRLLLVRSHLPWSIATVHAVAWGIRTFGEALQARSLRGWLHAWNDGLMLPVVRRPIDYRVLWQLHRRGGRVLW